MSLWRNVRGEMAGAWRSIRYDLRRRPAGRRKPEPDVTSTGMNTFPGSMVDLPGGQPEVDARPPRRFVAVIVFCALALGGAAGSYLVATTMFDGRMTDAAAPAPAIAAPLPPAFTDDGEGGRVAMGRVPAAPRTSRATNPAAITPDATTAAPARTTRTTSASANVGPRTGTRRPVTSGPECHCETPPVPTPTAAPETPPASGPVSPSPSASPAEPDDPSISAVPDDGFPAGDSDRLYRRYWP